MKKKNAVLGIDSSNYTSSLALVDENGILADSRIILNVKEGNRGLRQSEAFYQHSNNFPEMFRLLEGFENIGSICVSDRPRRVEGSYMPCFKAGENYAKVLSCVLNVPIFKVSHQEGHIRAALIDTDIDEEKPFLCVHLSGGTTEILLAQKSEFGYKTEIIGKTIDISAGMFIDRIGVSMGKHFPCGANMDAEYIYCDKIKLPVCVYGTDMSFSGVETKVQQLLKRGDYSEREIVTGVFDCVSKTLIKATKNCIKKYGVNTVVFAGGVSSGKNISSYIKEALQSNAHVVFANKRYATDNAVGVALLGLEFSRGE